MSRIQRMSSTKAKRDHGKVTLYWLPETGPRPRSGMTSWVTLGAGVQLPHQ